MDTINNINTMFRVSIVIPSYNVSGYIEECIESLLIQTLKDFEIILVNDCSCDDTLEICERYAEIDSRVKVINNSVNVGLAETRNVGLRHAKGELVVFVDSDDFIDDERFLQEIYNNSSDIDMLFYGYSIFDERKKIKKSCYDSLSKINSANDNAGIIKYLSVTKSLCWTAWTHAYRRNFLNKNDLWFDSSLRQAEDCDFFYKALVSQPRIKGIDNVNYMYRQRGDSLTGEPKKTTLYGVQVTKQTADLVMNADLPEDYRKALLDTIAYNYSTVFLNIQKNFKGKETKEIIEGLKEYKYLNNYGRGKKLKLNQLFLKMFGLNFGSFITYKIHSLLR